jgi:TonB-linked SusC/RagA family outer membrane protein
MKKKCIWHTEPFPCFTKTWKIMRLSVFFLFVIVAQSWALDSYSQVTRLSLDMKGARVIDVLGEIENKTEFFFLFNQKLLDVERRVDIEVRQRKIEDILNELFAGTNVNYLVMNRQIVLTTAQPGSEEYRQQTTVQQQEQVTGKVTDSFGQPLPGVTVVIKGTVTGTITNANGNYSLGNLTPDATLVFSFLGMRMQEIVVGGQALINVIMEVDAIGIEEVVAVGYGTQRKADLTGAVSTVKTEKLTISPVASTHNTLVGQIPGLVSRQLNGEPGKDAASLSIRGFGAALIIVDGVERQFNTIDPNSIESVTVLKDASAAIYGARAGNGVILVTTKRGKTGEPNFQLNSSYSLQGFTNFAKPYNAGQYTEMWLEAEKNDRVPEANWRFSEANVQKYYDGTDPRYPNTNWFDVMVRDWSPQQQHNLSMQGGNDKIKYYGMLGTMTQEGFVKTGDHVFNRYNVVSNIDAEITENLSASLNLSVINSNLVAPLRSYQSGTDNRNIYFQDLFVTQPVYPASYPDPTKIPATNAAFHPSASADINIAGYRKNRVTESNMSGGLEYKTPFLKGLKAEVFVNYVQRDVKTKDWEKSYTAYTYDYDTDIYTPVKAGGVTSLSQGVNWNSTLTGQFSLQYNNTFKKHKISALALYEVIDTKGEGIGGSRRNYLSTAIDQLFAGGTVDQQITGSASEFGRIGYIGRTNYSFAQKYLLQVTARYDASPKFAPDNRWGFFPSVSAGWRISEEAFMKSIEKIENLKLRLSYSNTGYDATGNFQYLSGYQLGQGVLFGNSSIPGLYSTGLANPNIFWEEMTIYNAGLDFAFFKSKLYGEFDIFYRQRNGLLATRIGSLPNTFGASLPAENLNDQSNRGFELMLGTQGNKRDFTYNIEGNISWTRAKWDKFDEPEYTDPDDIRIKKQTGKWLGRQFGFKSDGLFTSQEEIDAHPLDQDNRGNVTIRPGDIKFVDISGPEGVPDGKLDWRDHYEMGGSDVPQIFFGLYSTLQYKNLDFVFLLQGATRSTLRVNPERYTGTTGVQEAYKGRWTPEDNRADARFPLRSLNQANNNRLSDFWIVDGSYARLKSASLGYTMPSSFLSKKGIDKIRFSVSGTNLFTIDKATALGIDPETPNGGAGFYYPPQRTISFGLNLIF